MRLLEAHAKYRELYGPLRKEDVVDLESAIAELQERLASIDKAFRPQYDVRDYVNRKNEGRS